MKNNFSISIIRVIIILVLVSGTLLIAETASKNPGAWIQIESTEKPDYKWSNSQWQHTSKSKGLYHSGKKASDAWVMDTEGTVNWSKSPPPYLTPGQICSIDATLKVWENKGKRVHGGDSVNCSLNLEFYRKDGSYVDYPGGNPKTSGRAKIGGKTRATAIWSEKWTVPNGREGVILRVMYSSSNPGGICRTTYHYRWDANHSGDQPKKKNTIIAPGLKKKKKLKLKLTSNKTTFKVGETIALNAIVSGPPPPYKFLWFGRHHNNSASVNTKAITPGSKNYSVQVTDKEGQTASDDVTIIIYKPLTVTLSSAKRQIKLNEKIIVKARVTGDTGPYSYLWQGRQHSKKPTIRTWFNNPGKAPVVTVVVTDKYGQKANARLTFTFPPKSSLSKMVVKLIPRKEIKVLVGRMAEIRTLVQGGKAPYKYKWGGIPNANTGVDWPQVSWGADSGKATFISRRPAEYMLFVKVRDSKGQMGSDSVKIKVMGVSATLVHNGPPKNMIPKNRKVLFIISNLTSNLDGIYAKKPLYILWQPHPEVTFEPFENLPGQPRTTYATFTTSGPITVWAEIFVELSPEKIKVGEASIDVTIVE